jgi:hypothetical protein
MEITRRKFAKMVGSAWLLAFAVGSTLFVAGCGVWADIIAYAPVGISAVTSLLNLLGSFGIIPVGTGTAAAALISSITTLWNDVVADVKIYQSEPASATLAKKIEDELQSISTQISQFLANLNLGTSAQAQLIQALLSLILTTIAGFISAVAAKSGVPIATAKALSRRKVMLQGTAVLVIEPVYRNRQQFMQEFNATLNGAGQSQFDVK